MQLTRHRLVPLISLLMLSTWPQPGLCQPAGTDAVKKGERSRWSDAARRTWSKYVRSKRTESEYLPLSCWAEPIRQLDPLYVYHHRVNIVVVLRREGDEEEGIYIRNWVSSFIPDKGKEVDGFTILDTDDVGFLRFARRIPTSRDTVRGQ